MRRTRPWCCGTSTTSWAAMCPTTTATPPPWRSAAGSRPATARWTPSTSRGATAPTYANPGQQLDFARYSSDELLAHYRALRDVLREVTPDPPAGRVAALGVVRGQRRGPGPVAVPGRGAIEQVLVARPGRQPVQRHHHSSSPPFADRRRRPVAGASSSSKFSYPQVCSEVAEDGGDAMTNSSRARGVPNPLDLRASRAGDRLLRR